MRKSRYNPAGANVGNKSSDANANTYRGPVLKNGLHISQQLAVGHGMGSMPGSTKNSINHVQNKFSNRDQSPKHQQNSNGSIPPQKGHQAQMGFQ